jgi:hypothetical protein
LSLGAHFESGAFACGVFHNRLKVGPGAGHPGQLHTSASKQQTASSFTR